MAIRDTLTTARARTEVLAYDSIPIPGIADRLNTFGGWVTFACYSACGIAILVGGGFIAWDKITDNHGGGKGVKIAIGSIAGTMLISVAATVINAAKG